MNEMRYQVVVNVDGRYRTDTPWLSEHVRELVISRTDGLDLDSLQAAEQKRGCVVIARTFVELSSRDAALEVRDAIADGIDSDVSFIERVDRYRVVVFGDDGIVGFRSNDFTGRDSIGTYRQMAIDEARKMKRVAS